MVKKLGLMALLCLISIPLAAQSVPSAEGPGRSLWAGAEISSFNPDYGCSKSGPFSCIDRQLLGVGVYADENRLLGKLGVEGEARWLNWRGGGSGIKESSYMAGPRYEIIEYRRLSAYAKAQIGAGVMSLPKGLGDTTSLAFAPGLTAEYSVTRRVSLRLGYEYQFWPSFKGTSPNGSGGLTPNGFSLGLGYRLRNSRNSR